MIRDSNARLLVLLSASRLDFEEKSIVRVRRKAASRQLRSRHGGHPLVAQSTLSITR